MWTRGLVVLVAAIVLLGAGAAGAIVMHNRSVNARDSIVGTLELTDSDGFRSTTCSGSGGYSDIRAGSAVTVKDDAGKIIGISQLDPGNRLSSYKCAFRFEVTVPHAKVYQVEVSHRGGVPYERARLVSEGWSVVLSLGS